MSVISAINLTVHNTIFSNTAGTSPVRETIVHDHVSPFPINCEATRQDKTDPGLHKEDPKQKIVFVSSSSCRFRQAAGVDLEPDHPHEPMVNISFTDCSCVGNAGGGFQIYLGTYNASASPFRSDPTLFLLFLSIHKFLNEMSSKRLSTKFIRYTLADRNQNRLKRNRVRMPMCF